MPHWHILIIYSDRYDDNDDAKLNTAWLGWYRVLARNWQCTRPKSEIWESNCDALCALEQKIDKFGRTYMAVYGSTPMLNERRPVWRLFFNMGLLMPVRQRLYIGIGTGPFSYLVIITTCKLNMNAVSKLLPSRVQWCLHLLSERMIPVVISS